MAERCLLSRRASIVFLDQLPLNRPRLSSVSPSSKYVSSNCKRADVLSRNTFASFEGDLEGLVGVWWGLWMIAGDANGDEWFSVVGIVPSSFSSGISSAFSSSSSCSVESCCVLWYCSSKRWSWTTFWCSASRRLFNCSFSFSFTAHSCFAFSVSMAFCAVFCCSLWIFRRRVACKAARWRRSSATVFWRVDEDDEADSTVETANAQRRAYVT